MKKLFLHIGPHKTGSTFIQKFFFENRDRLSQHGVGYPNIDLQSSYGHQGLVENVKGLDQHDLDKHIAQFLDSDVVVISSENFDRLTLAEVQRLGRSVSGMEVCVIYYYRNYADMLPSWWQEEVKFGSTKSFYEYLFPHILRPFLSNIINPAVVLDSYATVFGKNNIVVISYDDAISENGILFPMLDLLGLKLGDIADNSINKSLPLELVELIRALNIIAHHNKQLSANNIRKIFLKEMHSDTIISEVNNVVRIIEDCIKPLNLSGGFFESAVKANFHKKYDSCLYKNSISDWPSREILVPSDDWMLKEDAFPTCQRIYKSIIERT